MTPPGTRRARVPHRAAWFVCGPAFVWLVLLPGCPKDEVSLGDDTLVGVDAGLDAGPGGSAVGGSSGTGAGHSGGGGGFLPPLGGASGAACGTRGQPSCGPNQFCAFDENDACGESDRSGRCQSLPTDCTAEFNPLCGCDGRAYPNACVAAIYGTSVRHVGLCSTDGGSPTACGGPFRCPPDQFCRFGSDGSCGGSPSSPGVCTQIPSDCKRDSRSVCGCNGRSYPGECAAAMDGVSVQHAGPCDANMGGGGNGSPSSGNDGGMSARICGGFAGTSCDSGEYCDLAAGDGCDVADARGVCHETPQACQQQLAPVCGCDGINYPNDCAAAASGVSIAHDGECP